MSIVALPFLYVQFSQCTVFTKATPTNYRDCHNFNCYINERETPKTCLSNHKSSISHHITPLVIISLRGGYTHTHAHTHARKNTHIVNKSDFKKPVTHHPKASMPGLKINPYSVLKFLIFLVLFT